MKRWARYASEDGGFSLIELTIATLIGLMVLTVAYLLFEAGMKSFRDIENHTIAARDAQQCVDRITRPMREMELISSAGDYDIEFLADPNDDGNRERLHFYILVGSAKLMLDRGHENTSTGSFDNTDTVMVADDVRNRIDGDPMFVYLSSPGTTVTAGMVNPANLTVARKSVTHFVRLKVVTRPNTKPTPAPYSVQTEILMRNNIKL